MADQQIIGQPVPANAVPVAGKKSDGSLVYFTFDSSGNLNVNTGGAITGPVTIADGADVAEGATTDAKVVGDNPGTVSAKLRGLSYLLNLVIDTINGWLKVSVQNASIPVTQSGSWSVLNTFNPGTADVFGSLRTAQQNNQVDLQFYRDTPANLVTVTATGGTATNSLGGGLFATGAGTSNTIKGVTFSAVAYHGGSEIYAYFTAVFSSAGLASSYMRIGLYDTNNGAFIGYEGTSFGVTYRNATSDTTTAQASFNGDTLTGTAGSKFTRAGVPEAANFQKFNVFRIRIGWVGGAQIIYEILSPDGVWVTFHTIRFPNLGTAPSIQSADLPMTLDIAKTSAGATDLSILTGCWAAGNTYQIADRNIIGQGSQTAGNQNICLDVAGSGPLDCFQFKSVALQVIPAAGTITAGIIAFEASNDNVNWTPVFLQDVAAPNAVSVSAYVLAASTNRYFTGPIDYRYFRARIRTGITGTTTGVQCFTNLRTSVHEPDRKFIRTGVEPPPTSYAHLTHAPAANTKATITLAAGGATVRNVCTGLTVSLAAGATAPAAIQTSVALIDGASGGTTYLWGPNVIALPATAGAVSAFVIGRTWKPGTANTAMTLEFAAAGGANTIESVEFDATTIIE